MEQLDSLPTNSVVLKNGEQVVVVIGTAHLSKQSCEQVRKVIQTLRPQVVMVELCFQRKHMLQRQRHEATTLKQSLDLVMKGKSTTFAALYGWLLSKLGEELKVLPGEEFRVAYEEGKKIGAEIVLGDRPATTTIARMWDSLSFWRKTLLICEILFSGLHLPIDELEDLLEKVEDTDLITEMIKDLDSRYPGLVVPLIQERDQYMVGKLQLIQASPVVAVVGAGHLPGIKKNWGQHIDLKELSRKPTRSSKKKYAVIVGTSVGVAGLLTLIWWFNR